MSPGALGEPAANTPAGTGGEGRQEGPFFVGLLVGVVALLGVGLGGGLYWKHRQEVDRSRSTAQARQLTDFRLIERSGRAVDREEFRGRILVVNFVFSGCSLACYEVSRRMAELQTYVAAKPQVQLVSFSVDPRTDTPEVLSAFADRLKADARRWTFLTGEKAEVYRVIETSFLPKAPAEAPSLVPGNFDRAERIVLVDGDGRVRRYFDGMSPNVVAEVLDALAALEKGLAP